MAVLVRSTAASLGTLRRAMITAGVPVTVRGEDIPLAEQPAWQCCWTCCPPCCARTHWTRTSPNAYCSGPIGGGDSVYLRRLRRVLRRAFPDEGGRLAPVVGDAPGGGAVESVRPPVLRGHPACWRAGRSARDQSPEDCSGDLDASGLARRWEAASVGGGVSGAAADRDLDAVVQLFVRWPASSTGSRRQGRTSSRAPGRPADPGDTFSPTASETRGGRRADRPCQQGPGVGSGLRSPTCRRHLAGSAPPRLAARHRTARRHRGRYRGRTRHVGAPQLAEERRLFYVAATRAREELVVTAVSGEDEQPSRFLDELDPIEGDRPMTQPQRGVHLPGLVAELRAVVCTQDAPVGERRRRGGAGPSRRGGVAGADPDEWLGLAALSTEGRHGRPDRPVRSARRASTCSSPASCAP